MPALELDVDPAPGLVHAVARANHAVVDPDQEQDQDDDDREDDDDGPHRPSASGEGERDAAQCRDSTLPGVIALTLTAPLAYEANPGIVQGVAPPGTTALRVRADGHSVRVLRLTSGKRAFLVGPIGLPPRDLTLTVEALAGTRVLASARVEHVFGLPAAAAAGRAAALHRRRRAAQRRGLPARTGVTSAAWIRDLATGRTAAYNAGAHFPAASTIKLAILLGVLARDDADPLRSSSWSLERSLVLNSSNLAANELLPRAGGARPTVDTYPDAPWGRPRR